MKVTPFLLFDGNCAEAMEFYQRCLGGELMITKLKETPMKDQMPVEYHERVVNARLKSGSIEFSATDWLHQTRKRDQGNAVGLYINGGAYAELEVIFKSLSVGGDPALMDELRDMPFGSYGHLSDRYGVHWFFQGERKAGR